MKDMKKIVVLLICLIAIVPCFVNAKNDKKSKNVPEVKETVVNNTYLFATDFQKDKASDLAVYSFDVEGTPYILIKQSTNLVIWTEKEVKNEAEFITGLKEVNTDSSLTTKGKEYFEKAVFVSGLNVEIDLEAKYAEIGEKNPQRFPVIIVTKEGNTYTLTCSKTISHADAGTYIDLTEETPKEKEYKWEISVGEGKTAVGYYGELNEVDFLSDTTKWRVLQYLDFSEKDSYTYTIGKGAKYENYGYVTITNNENEYTVIFDDYTKFEPEITAEDIAKKEAGEDVVKVVKGVLSDAKYRAETTIFTNPSQGLNKVLTELKSGTTFKLDAEKIYFYAHFDAVDVTYTLVEK